MKTCYIRSMIENAKYFDVHDKDVTPEIYSLLFCDAFVELTGNDTYYRILPLGSEFSEDGWKTREKTECTPSSEERFSKRLKRGPKNCYHNFEAMRNLCENPCTCEYAVQHFKEWLTERGVTKNDVLFVKIWW